MWRANTQPHFATHDGGAAVIHSLLAVIALAGNLSAATYYVASGTSTPAGSDSNNGAIGTPWKTLARAFNPLGSPAITCGDTIMVVADGNFVNGDATIPWLPCTATITVQSSLYNRFAPDGYRTNPAVDCADSSHCLYGRLTLTTGISWAPEVHGTNATEYTHCLISSIDTI